MIRPRIQVPEEMRTISLRRLRMPLLGFVLWYLRFWITAATDGMLPISHSTDRDMDPEIFDDLDDITDYDFLSPSKRPRLSDQHANSINLGSENSNAIEFFDDYFPDLSGGSTSTSTGSRSTRSSDTWEPKDKVPDVGIYHATNPFQASLPLMKDLGWQGGVTSDRQAAHQPLPTVKTKLRGHRKPGESLRIWGSRAALLNTCQPINQVQLSENTNKPHDLEHFITQKDIIEGQESQQIFKDITDTIYRNFESFKADQSTAQLMKGFQQFNRAHLPDEIHSVIPQKDQNENQRNQQSMEVETTLIGKPFKPGMIEKKVTVKKPVQKNVGASYKELDKFRANKKLAGMVKRTQNLSWRQNAEDKQIAKSIQKKIKMKMDVLKELYKVRINPKTKFKLGNLLQQPDPEVSDKDIIIHVWSPQLGLLDQDGKKAHHNVYIKIPLQSETKLAHNKANRLVGRIKRIALTLNNFNHYLTLDREDEEEPGNLTNQDHQDLMEWFYDLIFTDTQDHLPLLGWAQLKLPMTEENSHKRLNPSQILLYKSLTQQKKFTRSQSAHVSLQLRKTWYQFKESRFLKKDERNEWQL
ncbi:hypothetical protein PGT21_034381 [Puccinia graminis f. sp. tritici]|uniref:Uncharacterized protein n=1 Tax=Puccinia graminis f. sp. tritici TaxID=56615 RepID=A0A5B0P9W0_PUCGR|nr:hypothetical protein PGT21_034381 [Puccinia graminis f. sp. tritici]